MSKHKALDGEMAPSAQWRAQKHEDLSLDPQHPWKKLDVRESTLPEVDTEDPWSLLATWYNQVQSETQSQKQGRKRLKNMTTINCG